MSIDTKSNRIQIVWAEKRVATGPHHLMYKNSSDGGISWSSSYNLSYDGVYAYGGPQITMKNNDIHVMWHKTLPSDRRAVYYKRYPDFPDTFPPDHSNEIPVPESFKDAPGTNISVHVTDPSGVNESTIQLIVNGSLVSHTSTPRQLLQF